MKSDIIIDIPPACLKESGYETVFFSVYEYLGGIAKQVMERTEKNPDRKVILCATFNDNEYTEELCVKRYFDQWDIRNAINDACISLYHQIKSKDCMFKPEPEPDVPPRKKWFIFGGSK